MLGRRDIGEGGDLGGCVGCDCGAICRVQIRDERHDEGLHFVLLWQEVGDGQDPLISRGVDRCEKVHSLGSRDGNTIAAFVAADRVHGDDGGDGDGSTKVPVGRGG